MESSFFKMSGATFLGNDERESVLAPPGSGPEDSGLPFQAHPSIRRPLACLLIASANSTVGPRPWVPLEGTLTIGSAPTSAGRTLALDDSGVAKNHVRITPTSDGGFEVVALESNFGTRISGIRVKRPVRLFAGVTIIIGGHLLVFRFLSPADLETLAREATRPVGLVPSRSVRMSGAIEAVRHASAKGTFDPLLVTGPFGSGRETIARALHKAANRGGNFVVLDCESPPPEIEAVIGRLGGLPAGGQKALSPSDTLFLRNVDHLSPRLQGVLARIWDRRPGIIGKAFPRATTARVIATPAYETASQIDSTLRSVFAKRITLPGLFDRPEDLPFFIAHSLQRRRARFLTHAALVDLTSRRWLSNIPELQTTIAHASECADIDESETIHRRHLPPEGSYRKATILPSGTNLGDVIDAFGKKYGLTDAESEVLQMSILGGFPNKEIATKRGAAETTVRNQWHDIYKKTGLTPQASVVAGVLRLAATGRA